MKPLFHIHSDHQPGARTLLMEIGPDTCSYAFLDRTSNVITELKYFEMNELEAGAQLQTIIGEIADKKFEEVVVCAGYSLALLTPFKYAEQSDPFLELIYDQPAQQHFKDNINEWQMVNTYSLPSVVFDLVREKFPLARFLHAYTPALKVYNGFASEDQVSIHFTTQHFRVLVKKGGQVQLGQIYAYKTPLDVVYYLLKICAELQMNQSDVHLVLSGFVEEASALYKELYNYFLHIHFAQPSAITIPGTEYPQHFFTSTYNLAACVS